MKAPLSLETFADWLGTMPADGTYNYADSNNCAICQYFDAIGLKYFGVGGYGWVDPELKWHDLPARFNDASVSFPNTFGAAHQRARAMLRR